MPVTIFKNTVSISSVMVNDDGHWSGRKFVKPKSVSKVKEIMSAKLLAIVNICTGVIVT